jgi:NTE family protein
MSETIRDLLEPVRRLPTDPPDEPTTGTAVCLSGGGYRAMLFHAGVLWRLCDSGWLSGVDRVSSVSGGSITAAALALAWGPLMTDSDPHEAFAQRVIGPLRELAARTIDRSSVITGLLSPFSTIAEELEGELRRNLLGDARLRDLPPEPKFVFNATNTGSGKLVRFTREGVADWRVGRVQDSSLRLSAAVTASSAFPPFLSPYRLNLKGAVWKDDEGNDLTSAEYRDELVLTDGGVYDNLGLETAWKRCHTILVSDAGGELSPEPDPARDWAQHTRRIIELLDHQVRSLRKRQIVSSLVDGRRDGAYIGIRSDIIKYKATGLLPAPVTETIELARIETRLKQLRDSEQEHLINWGYAIADAGLRSYVDRSLPAPSGFPCHGGVS